MWYVDLKTYWQMTHPLRRMQLGRRDVNGGWAANERFGLLKDLVVSSRRLRLHIQKGKERVLDERGNTSIRTQNGMNTGRANRRLGIRLKMMGDGNTVGPRAPVAKPGDEQQCMPDVMCFIEPKQQAARRRDFDLLQQQAYARLQQHGPINLGDQFFEQIAGAPSGRHDQSTSVDFRNHERLQSCLVLNTLSRCKANRMPNECARIKFVVTLMGGPELRQNVRAMVHRAQM